MQIVSAVKKKLDRHVKNENIRDSAEKKIKGDTKPFTLGFRWP